MKKAFQFLFSLLLLANIVLAQGSFSYKRQLSYKQCDKCNCKKSRNYKLVSSNLTSNQKKCAENDMNAEIKTKEFLQGGTSGGLFAAYNAPQEGCGDDCDHDFKFASDNVETVQIEECLSESQKQKMANNKQSLEDEKIKRSEDEPVLQPKQEKAFTGLGVIQYDAYGTSYEGAILNGEPHGSGKLTSKGYLGYLECTFSHGQLSSWKYLAEKDGNQISTRLFGEQVNCKINNKTVFDAKVKNCDLISGEMYFESGNILSVEKRNYSFFSKKQMINGSILEGEFYVSSYILNNIHFAIVGCIPVFVTFPSEVFLNGKGTLYLKDEIEIKGNFTNDKIDASKVNVHFKNGDNYSGEISLAENLCFMNGYGILTTKKGKTKTGYWQYGEYVGKKLKK